MHLLGIPLREIAIAIICLWVLAATLGYVKPIYDWIRMIRKHKSYTVIMFSKDSIASTLRKVEEDSVLETIMKHYGKPFYYIKVEDIKELNLEVIKESETEMSYVDVERYMREHLRKGSRIKILTTKDSSFSITIFKAYNKF